MSISGSLAKINKDVNKSTSKVFNNGNKKPGKLGGMVDSVSGIQKNVAGTVVGVGNIVAKAAGTFGGKLGQKIANSLTGSTKIQYKSKNEKVFFGGLEGFYNQFSGLSQNLPDVIDPFNTFECSFTFFPNIVSIVKTTEIKQSGQIDGEEVYSIEGIDEPEQTSVTTILGKLIPSIKNTKTETQVVEYSSIDIDDSNNSTTHTNVIKEDIKTVSTNQDMIINLGIYIQKVALPNVQIESGEDVQTLMGKFPIPGKIVAPSDNTFSMDIINVSSPIIENIFYPWMRETTLPSWLYNSQPFTTALISFDFSEHCNIKYHFVGCRPTHVQLIQPDQAPVQNLTRNVQFTFDYMTIEKVESSQVSKKQSKANMSSGAKNGNSNSNLANGALFSAINTLKL